MEREKQREKEMEGRERDRETKGERDGKRNRWRERNGERKRLMGKRDLSATDRTAFNLVCQIPFHLTSSEAA